MTSPTYWQAELQGRVMDADFPPRETREEAEDDARDGLSRLSARERQFTQAVVRQWSRSAAGDRASSNAAVVTLD